MSLPRAPIPDTALQSYLNQLVKGVQRFTPSNSDTITARNTSTGTVYEVNDHIIPRNFPMNWQDLYVAGDAYSIGAMVFVSSSFTTTIADGTQFQSIAGVYVCTSPIPPKVDTSTLTDPFLIAYYTDHSQASSICYAPIYPYPTDTNAYLTTDGKGKYWHLVTSTPCDDGSS